MAVCGTRKAPAPWHCTRVLGHEGPCACISPGLMTQNEFVRKIAEFVRTHAVVHGDQYGTYCAPSADADDLARAIESEFIIE